MKIQKRKRTVLPAVIIGIACLLFLCAIGLTAEQFIANSKSTSEARKAVALANSGQASAAPSTIKPTAKAVNSYEVPATHPRYLLIPKLSLRARVIPVGLTKDNAIGTPSDAYDTAWYTGSNLPGQPGATLIDGHVLSWTTHGVFYDLKTLVAGDKIQVELGSGTVITYTVIKTTIFDNNKVDVPSLLRSVDSKKPGLNLITCTGQPQNGGHNFTQRFVVYATQD